MTELTQRLSQEQTQDETQLALRKTHIKVRRYRVYIFFLLIIIVLIEPFFTQSIENVRWTGAGSVSLSSISWWFAQRGEGGKLAELEQVQVQIEEVKQEINKTQVEIAIVNSLQDLEKQNTLLNCINFDFCSPLQQGLLDRIDLLRSYLIVTQLSAEKLDFDQKFILRNINEFLSQKSGVGQLVEVTSISFDESSQVKPEFNLYKVPLNLHVKYTTNSHFMSFLHNIESKMSPTLPVMRRINSVNYDIVNYLDSQEVSMSMSIYYFKFDETEKLAWKKVDIDHASAE